MHFRIVKVSDLDELENIYHLRYKISAEELRYKYEGTIYWEKKITDSVDCQSTILGAYFEDRLIGTVRSTFFRTGCLGETEERLGLHKLNLPLQTMAMTSRLVVEREFRGTSITHELSKAVYKMGIEQHITHDLVEVSEHIVPLMKRFGYVEIAQTVYPSKGPKTLASVMILDALNEEHLAACHSCFLPILREFKKTF